MLDYKMNLNNERLIRRTPHQIRLKLLCFFIVRPQICLFDIYQSAIFKFNLLSNRFTHIYKVLLKVPKKLSTKKGWCPLLYMVTQKEYCKLFQFFFSGCSLDICFRCQPLAISVHVFVLGIQSYIFHEIHLLLIEQ